MSHSRVNTIMKEMLPRDHSFSPGFLFASATVTSHVVVGDPPLLSVYKAEVGQI